MPKLKRWSFTSCRPIALFLSANTMAYAVAASGKCSPIRSRSDISKSKWKIIWDVSGKSNFPKFLRFSVLTRRNSTGTNWNSPSQINAGWQTKKFVRMWSMTRWMRWVSTFREPLTRCWLLRNAGYRMIYPTVSATLYVTTLTNTITLSSICAHRKVCCGIWLYAPLQLANWW